MKYEGTFCIILTDFMIVFTGFGQCGSSEGSRWDSSPVVCCRGRWNSEPGVREMKICHTCIDLYLCVPIYCCRKDSLWDCMSKDAKTLSLTWCRTCGPIGNVMSTSLTFFNLKMYVRWYARFIYSKLFSKLIFLWFLRWKSAAYAFTNCQTDFRSEKKLAVVSRITLWLAHIFAH